jgi:hypothetical protein
LEAPKYETEKYDGIAQNVIHKSSAGAVKTQGFMLNDFQGRKRMLIPERFTRILGFCLVAFLAVGVLKSNALSQGMMRGAGDIQVPESLPKPQDKEWIADLESVLALEELSQAQYEADSNKYNLRMPYVRVIPDERNHIRWLRDLFSAYNMDPSVKKLSPKQTKDAEEAYQVAMKLEEDLIPKYESLIERAHDDETSRIIDSILLETRMHYTMFSHGLRMGGKMGGRGHHWMRGGRGKRGGHGPGMGGHHMMGR